MIYTSYFAKYKGNQGVAICLWLPTWVKNIEHYPALAPTKEILERWNKSNKTEEDIRIYSEAYKKEILNKLDVHKVAQELNDKVLLCYERPTDFCHRHLVREWLNSAGYECKEMTY